MDQCANFVRTGLGASVCAVPSGDRSRLRRQGLCQDKAPGANGAEPVEHLGGDLQHPRPGMPDHLAREVKQTPAYGGHFVPPPVRIECGLFEQDEQVVRDEPMRKKAALAENCPQGMRSIPKPIFGSLIPFSETSPRWRYQIGVSAADSTRLLAMTWCRG